MSAAFVVKHVSRRCRSCRCFPCSKRRIFYLNTMNFERPKFNPRLENRLEALRAFKKNCGYIFKGSLVYNISNERKRILVQDRLGPEGQKIYNSLDWFEGEDINDYDLTWTKLERAVSPECNEIVSSKLKSCSESLISVITNIINSSLESGIFPDCCKEAVVIPLL